MKAITSALVVMGLFMGMSLPLQAQDDVKGPVNVSIAVPNVVGKSLTEAINTLKAAGLNRETQQSDRDGEARIVIRQDPAAGTRVRRGSVVKIYGQLANADQKGRVTLPVQR
jgi:hypothetical protein